MKTILLTVVLVLSFVAPALAETLKVTDAGVQFEKPTGWKSAAKGQGSEGVLITLSPDEEASMIFAVAEGQNLEKAIKALDGMLGKFVTDAKTQKGGKVTINGMKGIAAKGTAKAGGVDVKTGVLILGTKANKILFVVGIVNAAKEAAYKQTFDEVLKSIKPL